MMVMNETFRRVPQIYVLGGQSARRFTRRDAASGSRVSKTGGRESEQTRPETRLKKKTESSYAAFRFRPLGNRNLESDFRFFVLLRRQFCVSQSLAYDLRTQQTETVCIIHWIIPRGPIIESECLLVNVPKQMKRLYGNVSSAKAALQQRPEVFHTLSMNLPVHILLKVIDELVLVLCAKFAIAGELVSHNRRTPLNKIADGTMHAGILAISDDSRLNFASALKRSDYHGLSVTA